MFSALLEAWGVPFSGSGNTQPPPLLLPALVFPGLRVLVPADGVGASGDGGIDVDTNVRLLRISGLVPAAHSEVS